MAAARGQTNLSIAYKCRVDLLYVKLRLEDFSRGCKRSQPIYHEIKIHTKCPVDLLSFGGLSCVVATR